MPKDGDAKRQYLEMKKMEMKFVRLVGESKLVNDEQTGKMEEAIKYLSAVFKDLNIEIDDKLLDKMKKKKKKKK